MVLWLGVIATTTTSTSTKVLFVFCRRCAFVCDSSCSSVCCWLKRRPLIRFRPISVFLLALADLKTRLVVRLRVLLLIITTDYYLSLVPLYCVLGVLKLLLYYSLHHHRCGCVLLLLSSSPLISTSLL